jgi:hypothetical protein
MSESHLRLVSLSILGGPLDGRRYSPDEVVAEILIGSDPGCHLVADLPGISPIHAKVWADLDESMVHDTSAPRGVYVNDQRVEREARIGMGDVLWLGAPHEPESVCVECRFEPWVEVLPSPAGYAGDAPVPADPQPGVDPAEEAVVADAVVAEAIEVGEPVEGEPLEVVEVPPPSAAGTPTAGAVAPPAGEEDPFFVGEAASSAPAGVQVPEAPAPADEWSFAEEPLAPAEASVPVADEFFVAAEPAAEAPPVQPAFVIPEPFESSAADEPAPAAVPLVDLPPLEPLAPPTPAAAVAPIAPVKASAPVKPAAPVPAPAQKAAEPARKVEAARPATVADPAPVEAKPEAVEPKRADAPRAEQPAAAKPAARPHVAPARRPTPAPAARRAPARPVARARGGPSWVRPVALGGGAAVLLGVVALGVMRFLPTAVRLDAVEPARVRVGQRATLSGSGFGSDPSALTVVFGEREARVVSATPERIEVEVPEAVAASGSDARVAVAVRARGRSSGALEVAVFQGPRLHGISPGAAMPGEEVLLAGAGWGVGAVVRFGSSEAHVLEVQPTQIRAVVPELALRPGNEAPVIVVVGGVESNPAPFIVGHLPVLTGLNPQRAGAGSVVTVSGRGFDAIPVRNDVRVGGQPALVLASSNESLQLVVPRLPPGEAPRAVELRVPGSTSVGQATLQLEPEPDPIAFHFVAEPFNPAPDRSHAVLATGLGPAFVLASSGGRTAAERAAVAADRLNAAAQRLRTTLGLTLEARGLEANPVIGLSGSTDVLLEVTPEDAAAYNEDWTGLRGRGGPVTQARLARWWEALGRDLALITVQGQPPQHAAALAPEGRALGQLFDLARRAGAAGVPRRVVEQANAPLRESLRVLGLRVPPSVTADSAPVVAAAGATPTPIPPLAFEGTWGGSQVEQSQRQYLSVTVRGGSGSVAYEGGITFTVPMLTLEKPRRDQVRFSVQIRGGVRHYAGRWDGEAITGNVTTDAAGKNVVATFELRRR